MNNKQQFNQEKKSKWWIWLIVIILVIIIVLFLIYYFYVNSKIIESSFSQEPNYHCNEDYYDCSDFSSQAEAQKVFDACGESNDIHQLDKDNDGVACEGLG